MSFSNTLETNVLKWAFTADSATRPTAWYVALYTSNPADDNSGTELSGSAYARTSATFTVSGNQATTSAAVEFPEATGSWGTVSHVAVFDASTGGNMLAYAALTTAKAIGTGDILRIPAGDLDITLD